MKKSLIAGAGVSALAFAALPFAGVFATAADPTPTSFTDSLSVTVQGGCTIETSATQGNGTYQNRSFSNTIATGTVGYLNDSDGQGTTTGATMTVSCNGADNTKAWTVTVTPPTSGTLKGTTDSTKTIAPGNQTSGADSGWAIQSNATGGTFSSNAWATYADAPTAAAEFLKGSLAQGGSGTFNPSYQVYVGPTQAPETYIGDVVYTVTVGNAS